MPEVYGPPAPTWEEVAPNEDAQFNVRYRTNCVCAGWTFALVDPGKIEGALKIESLVAGGHVRVKHLEIYAPGGIPDSWVARGAKKSDWGVSVTWEKASAGTPVFVLAGAVIVVITLAAIAFMVTMKWTEKELNSVIDHTKDLLQSTFFNPGVIVAVLAAIALFVRRR